MAFRVGQKVVCVKKGPWTIEARIDAAFWVPYLPQKGDVLTIRDIDEGHLRFVEIINPVRSFTNVTGEARFARHQFRPVQSTDTGMAILEQIRRDVSNKTALPIREDEQA
jgi:hypothetical protein